MNRAVKVHPVETTLSRPKLRQFIHVRVSDRTPVCLTGLHGREERGIVSSIWFDEIIAVFLTKAESALHTHLFARIDNSDHDLVLSLDFDLCKNISTYRQPLLLLLIVRKRNHRSAVLIYIHCLRSRFPVDYLRHSHRQIITPFACGYLFRRAVGTAIAAIAAVKILTGIETGQLKLGPYVGNGHSIGRKLVAVFWLGGVILVEIKSVEKCMRHIFIHIGSNVMKFHRDSWKIYHSGVGIVGKIAALSACDQTLLFCKIPLICPVRQ